MLLLQQSGHVRPFRRRPEGDRAEDRRLPRHAPVAAPGHRETFLAGEPGRHQHRRLGPVPEDGGPRQDGPLHPERRQVRRQAGHSGRLGERNVREAGSVCQCRDERAPATGNPGEPGAPCLRPVLAREQRLGPGLRLPDVALPPQRLPRGRRQWTVHPDHSRKRRRRGDDGAHSEYGSGAESDLGSHPSGAVTATGFRTDTPEGPSCPAWSHAG